MLFHRERPENAKAINGQGLPKSLIELMRMRLALTTVNRRQIAVAYK